MLGMSAYSVYKGKKPGEKVADDLIVPEILHKRKRRKSLQDLENGKKKKKLSPKKRLSLQGDQDLMLPDKIQNSIQRSERTIRKKSSKELISGEDLTACETSFFELFDPESFYDSRASARALFEMLIKPCPVDKFLDEIWEKKPILLRRSFPAYNNGWFSTQELNNVLKQNSLQYSINVNIASYENGERHTHNPIGRAYASTVWEFYKQGCSVQILNPQSYSKEMWLLGATLQELFGSFTGANVYLTPPGAQGFAPHYDDIEAFVMQVEGRKRWRLYKPRTRYEIMPRVSSRNFQQSELGELILDVILEPGDLLYFPRGTVHQANSLSDSHSLHITLSTFQRNSWGDLLEKMVPMALQTAITEDEDFRKSLPIDYLDYMGLVHADENNPKRAEFIDKALKLVLRIVEYAPFDTASDQMGLDFIHSSLPPFLTNKETSESGIWKSNGKLMGNGKIKDDRIEITTDSEVRIIRPKAIRAVENDENGTVLYYTTNNSRVYHEKEVEGMEIALEDTACITCLVKAYPAHVKVSDLPLENDENKIDFCCTLFNQGILTINSD